MKTIPINELKKQFPDLTEEDLLDIQKQGIQESHRHRSNVYDKTYLDKKSVQVLYFNYKTYMNEVYKVKETGTGADKIIPKDDSFNPPEEKEGGYSRLFKKHIRKKSIIDQDITTKGIIKVYKDLLL